MFKATFYFTGYFAKINPESVNMVSSEGHEIGCHGYEHDVVNGLISMDFNGQIKEIERAKETIEKAGDVKVSSFRAPACRLNADTVRALDSLGFTTDSSVCPQRFDGPFSFGSRQKLSWLTSPRKPYLLSKDSPFQRGDSNVLEIPVSALVFPYIGTVLRASPTLFKLTEKLLFAESRRTDKPVVFLSHPNELIKGDSIQTSRRSKGFIGHVFKDIMRQRIKMRNLGPDSIRLVEGVIDRAQKNGFEFCTANQYREKFK